MRVIESRRRIIVFDTPAQMNAFAAGLWTDRCREAVGARGLFTAAVSGGRTPEGFFRELSGMPDLSWDRTQVFLVDERHVSPLQAESNFRTLNENLLTKITIPPGNIHPVPVDLGPEEAALLYERTIRDAVPPCNGEIPCFDLMILGMGEDGHTASLFPGNDALHEQRHLVRHVSAPGVKYGRITMTLPLINASRNVVFLVSGGGKAKALHALIMQGDETLPAARVDPPHGSLVFCVDRSAAQLLAPAAFDEPRHD